MPQVTVYIRNEDLEKWAEIEKKSEFIHNTLNHKIMVGDGIIESVRVVPAGSIKTPKEYPKDVPDHFKGSSGKVPEAIKVIKSPKDAKENVDMGGFIPKSFSARKKK